MAEQKPFIKIYHRYVHNKKNGFDMFHYCLENKANYIDDLLKSRTFRRLKCKRKKRQKK